MNTGDIWAMIAQTALNYIFVSVLTTGASKSTVTDLKTDLRTTKEDIMSELKDTRETLLNQNEAATKTLIDMNEVKQIEQRNQNNDSD